MSDKLPAWIAKQHKDAETAALLAKYTHQVQVATGWVPGRVYRRLGDSKSLFRVSVVAPDGVALVVGIPVGYHSIRMPEHRGMYEEVEHE